MPEQTTCPKCGAEADRQLDTRAFYKCHSTSLESGFHQSPGCRIRELTADLLNCASTMAAQKAGIEQLTDEVARLNAMIETLRSGNDYKADACARLSSDNSRQRGEIRRLTTALQAAESILGDLAFERNFLVYIPECYHERITAFFREKNHALRTQ